MSNVKRSRQDWIDAGLHALARGGPRAVRVEALARDLGVTKGGFYGYFANKQDLLDAVLDHWERLSTTVVRIAVESETEDPATRLVRARDLTFAPDRLAGVELAIRDWARQDADVAARLRRVDDYRIAYLTSELSRLCSDPVEAEARAYLAFGAALGMHYTAYDAHEHEPARLLATKILLTPGSLTRPAGEHP